MRLWTFFSKNCSDENFEEIMNEEECSESSFRLFKGNGTDDFGVICCLSVCAIGVNKS